MKKGKLLASVLSGVMLLSAAFTMQSSAADTELVKDGNFPAGTKAWICVADENKTPEKPMKFEDGKVVLTEDMSNWLHLNQTLTVKPATKYKFTITYKLTAGAFRLDVWTPGADKPAEISCDAYEKGVRAPYGTEQTFEYTVKTGVDQTEFLLDIRNNCGDLGQAVGEITKVSFVEVDTTPPTKAPTKATDPTTKADDTTTKADTTTAQAVDSTTKSGDNTPTTANDGQNGSNWVVPVVIAAVVVVVGGGFAVWYFVIRPKKSNKN